ncbi:hypothetical protein E4U55_005024 [Claviceps digitariae]|nr:hypothetical protein E4U55_005024 [Claviceps digitariae]
MTDQPTAWNYARNEDCFTDHRGLAFDPDRQLESLKATAVSPQRDLLADECDRYCYSLASSDPDLEGDEDQPGSSLLLKKLQQQCKMVDEYSQLLPRWNDVYNNMALSTELMEGFDTDLDVAEYEEQRDPDLVQAWLPIFSLDDRKDEGLAFPPAAQKLELLLLHELENEKNLRSPADAKLAQIVSEAGIVNESLRNILTEPLKCVHEDMFLLPVHDVSPNVDRDRGSEPVSVISVMDLPCESNGCANEQRIESSIFKDCLDGNGMTTQSTQPYPCRGSMSCSAESAQFMTLPLLSSDSYDETQMVCDTPKGCDQSVSDNWSIVDCVSPTTDSMDGLPLPHNTSGGEITACGAMQLSKSPAQSPTHFTYGKEIDVARAKQMKSISTSEQVHQSDYVKENCGNKPPRSGLEREHFGSSHLLSQFMAVIGAKQRSTHPSSCSAMSVTASLPRSREEGVESTSVSRIIQRPDAETEVCHKQVLPAISPNISSPSQTGCCLVSIQLGHSVIRHLEEFWPANHLIDRDFCSHIGMGGNEWIHDGSLAMQSTTFEASEVDVSLTVEDGIIVTTLLQIRQKPLPSSKALTTIRQRVYHLSQKYTRLTIFVLESPGPRDDMSELSPHDLGIYTEFVCFASSLQANISVHLVPGGDKTISRWLLFKMIQFAPQLIELDKTTAVGNTTWELFFRQAGMNVRAAHVLSHGLFEEFGTSGLTAFLTMTTADQICEYGRKLGIERQVAQCSMVLGLLKWEKKELRIKQ